MRRTTEFATWLAARWPDLVRTLVFLGHPQPDAEALARETLARLLPEWERERRDGDVDLLVYRAILAHHERVGRRQDAPAVPRPPEEPDLPPGPDERLERRRALEAHLATLADDDRARAVLGHVAGLSEVDVDDVMGDVADGEAVPSLPLTDPEVRDACEAVPVGQPPVAAVLARWRSRRRTAWTRVAAVVVVAGLVVAGTTWWTSSGSDGERQGQVRSARNALPIPWWADGTLHLARVDVEVPGLEALFTVPDGVVFSDSGGDVVHVDARGRERQIGETVPGSRLVVESDNGWVAWADPGEGTPELVVHDTLGRTEVGRRPLSPPGTTGGESVGDHGPIAIDEERVFFSSPGGDFAWEPLIDVSFALSGTMVDTTGDARITRSDGVVRVTPLPYRTGTVIDATDARLTHDGRYAFAERDDNAFRPFEVYDVEGGRPVDLFSPSDEPVAWTYVDGTFYFAVLHMLQDKAYQDLLQMPSRGDYRVYACRPGRADPCDKVGEIPEGLPEPPVFPG